MLMQPSTLQNMMLQNLIILVEPTPTGDLLADMSKSVARKHATVGDDYKAVKEAVFNTMGVQLVGSQAWDARAQLIANPEFRYYPAIKRGYYLPSLPAGAIVVWGPTQNEQSYISIATGDGKEASDHMQNQ